MRLFTTIFFVIVASTFSHAQGASALPKNVRVTNVIQRLSYMTPSDLVYGIPMPEKELIGDGYLSLKWNPGSLSLYGTEKLVEGYPLRLDLLKNELELRTKSGIKVIDSKKINSFVWMDSLTKIPEYFVNAKDYKSEEGIPFIGFFRIIVDGRMPLFKLTEAYIKKSNYNAALDVGSRDDKIIKKDHFYYAIDGVAYDVPGSKKKFVTIFKEKKPEIEKFIRVNELVLNNQAHLARIFEYYNSLQ
jgi:hypothetical protein